MATKPWQGRFTGKVNKVAEEFNASIHFDCRLYKHDIMGSIAHAETLHKAKVLNKSEFTKIKSGLKAVEKDIVSGKHKFLTSDEDIHMSVEKALTKKIGKLGGKLHTARSRNDQVALASRLYLRDQVTEILELLNQLGETLIKKAEQHTDTIMPGYTHLQRAQPVLFAHHMLAYVEMFFRDYERFSENFNRINVMPLGVGALAGLPYKIDRQYTAKLLDFSEVTQNSLDTVSDRDYMIEFLSNASIFIMHASRISEELILWSSMEFGFVKISDAFSTGSSIMPQKKNPDMAELIRGKTGRVYGNLMSLLTTMKALPLAYNKDMQEDKEPLFDTIDTIKATLQVLTPMIKELTVNKENMIKATKEGFLLATDGADYLVGKGVPFRECHHIIGSIVKFCEKNELTLEDLTVKDWQTFSPYFEKDILKTINLEKSVNSRATLGGTAVKEVKKQIELLKNEFNIR